MEEGGFNSAARIVGLYLDRGTATAGRACLPMHGACFAEVLILP